MRSLGWIGRDDVIGHGVSCTVIRRFASPYVSLAFSIPSERPSSTVIVKSSDVKVRGLRVTGLSAPLSNLVTNNHYPSS